MKENPLGPKWLLRESRVSGDHAMDGPAMLNFWGAGALPWFIPTDPSDRVVAEGFALEELEAKLKANG